MNPWVMAFGPAVVGKAMAAISSSTPVRGGRAESGN